MNNMNNSCMAFASSLVMLGLGSCVFLRICLILPLSSSSFPFSSCWHTLSICEMYSLTGGSLVELRRDKESVILTTDKGVSMVVLDTEDYIKKSEELLNQPTYKQLSSDPTTKHKNRLISILKSIKSEGGIDNTTYKRLYPTGAGSPNTMGCPQYTNKVYLSGP